MEYPKTNEEYLDLWCSFYGHLYSFIIENCKFSLDIPQNHKWEWCIDKDNLSPTYGISKKCHVCGVNISLIMSGYQELTWKRIYTNHVINDETPHSCEEEIMQSALE